MGSPLPLNSFVLLLLTISLSLSSSSLSFPSCSLFLIRSSLVMWFSRNLKIIFVDYRTMNTQFDQNPKGAATWKRHMTTGTQEQDQKSSTGGNIPQEIFFCTPAGSSPSSNKVPVAFELSRPAPEEQASPAHQHVCSSHLNRFLYTHTFIQKCRRYIGSSRKWVWRSFHLISSQQSLSRHTYYVGTSIGTNKQISNIGNMVPYWSSIGINL